MSVWIEVYLNGQWGTVCDDLWGNPFNAKVVCRQLGLPWTLAEAKFNAWDFGPNAALPILMDDVKCWV